LPFVLQYKLSKKYCNTAVNTDFEKYWQYGGNTGKSIANTICNTFCIAILTTLIKTPPVQTTESSLPLKRDRFNNASSVFVEQPGDIGCFRTSSAQTVPSHIS